MLCFNQAKKNQQRKLKVVGMQGPGEEALIKVLHGEALPEVQTLTLLCTIFDRKSTPFVYLAQKMVLPFIYLLSDFY